MTLDRERGDVSTNQTVRAAYLCARAGAAGTVDCVFPRRSGPRADQAPTGELPRAQSPLRYDAAADIVVMLFGPGDLSQACPVESDDVCVLWDNGRVVGVAVSNASTHVAPDLISGCDALDTLSLGRLSQDT